MSKVKEQFKFKMNDSAEGFDLGEGYILIDVADDAEGYGVVFGDGNTDRTIAFGQGEAGLRLATILFETMKNEIEAILEHRGQITEVTEFMFEQLESPYDSDAEEMGASEESYQHFIDIIKYISIYHPKIEEF